MKTIFTLFALALSSVASISSEINPPSAWSFPLTDVVLRMDGRLASINGKYSATNYYLGNSIQPAPALTLYVAGKSVVKNANDTNNGLTKVTPKLTIPAAFSAIGSAPSAQIIILGDGISAYSFTNGLGNTTQTKNIQIISTNGQAWIFSGMDGPSFSHYSGSTYVVGGDTDNVIDGLYQNTNGAPSLLVFTNLISGVEGTPGYYTTNSGNTYIHLRDGRIPDYRVGTVGVSYNRHLRAQRSLVMRNINLFGGRSVFWWENNTDDPLNFLSAYNCKFVSAVNSNVTADAVFAEFDRGISINENTMAAWSSEDGFNYQEDNGYVDGAAFEINCSSVNNGYSFDDNGSTVHDGLKIIRINGFYAGNYSRAIHDIESGGSWNVNCVAGLSRSLVPEQNAAFTSGVSNSVQTTIMVLSRCKSLVESSGYDFQPWGSSSMYFDQTELFGKKIVPRDQSKSFFRFNDYGFW